ncbi:MAG: hypothetical protein ACI3ZL_04035 [Candidatus Cryptobacteroides sp.]
MRTRFLTSALLLAMSIAAYGQKYDRGYENVAPVRFVPKGSFMVGGSARFTGHRMDDYSFLVVEGIDSKGYTISFKPTFLYMVADNVAVGASFSYGRTLLDMESADLSISQITMSVDDYYRLAQTFTGALVFRPFIPLGRTGRFALFAQVELGYSNTLINNTVEISSGTKGTFTARNKMLVGINPGLTAFLSNHFAMELSVGILGFNYTWISQIHNQVEQGTSSLSNASFMLNLASVSVGLSYYL